MSRRSLVASLLIGELLLMSQLFVSLSQPILAETIFGNNYRHLTTVNPGGSNTSTSVLIAAGAGGVGTYVINPITSTSTLEGVPSNTSLSGYGWRTGAVAGINVPAGTWSFTVKTQSTVGTGTANVMVFAYSTDTLGTDIQNIGSATGTTNVLGIVSTQTETISFAASAMDLTNRILVVEYWLDVTTGPTLVAADVTFTINSSTETVVVPSSPSTTYYLGIAAVHSIGLDESLSTAESVSKISIPLISDNLITTESIMIQASFATIESVSIAEAISVMTTKPLSEVAFISDMASRDYIGTRSVSELLATADAASAGSIVQFAVSDAAGLQDQIAAVKTEAESEDEEETERGSNGDRGRRVQIVNSLKRVTIGEPLISLVLGSSDNTLNIEPNHTVLITSTIENEQSQLQPFAFVIQMTDSNGYTQSIEIVSGVLDPNKTRKVELPLVASSDGRFYVQIFCWSALQNGEPLSSVRSMDLFVTS